MDLLKQQLAALPTLQVGNQPYLSCQAVTDSVAAFLFPALPTAEIGQADYRRILETADTLCRELGYQTIRKLTPPDVPFSAMGLYWAVNPAPGPVTSDPEPAAATEIVHVGPGPATMMADGLLLDARLSQLGLDEVTRQHFKIPVTASDEVIDLMRRAVASDWPNDYQGIWHDILGMCIAGGRDVGGNERLFTVIIRGLGRRRYWRFQARLQRDNAGAPFLYICLADERRTEALFQLGQLVMTAGVAGLGIDVKPYLARHAAGDWGELDAFDRQQNETAVREGYRLLSAYDAVTDDGKTERIWIITEADRSCTTVLLPAEY